MLAPQTWTRSALIDLGVDRGLLQPGEPARQLLKVMERIRDEERPFAFNDTKPVLIRTVLDSIERAKRGRNPAASGSF